MFIIFLLMVIFLCKFMLHFAWFVLL